MSVIALLLASTARWLATARRSEASARSERAAAAGSSLAWLTRLPLVSCACAFESFDWRSTSVSSAKTLLLLVLRRIGYLVGQEPAACSIESKMDCATCRIFAAAW